MREEKTRETIREREGRERKKERERKREREKERERENVPNIGILITDGEAKVGVKEIPGEIDREKGEGEGE